jgi:hypothetical protein
VGPLQAALGQVLGERLSGFLEQTLKIAARQAKRARDVVEIEIGIGVVLRDLRQDRPPSGSPDAPARHQFGGVVGRTECGGQQVEQMVADDRRQLGRQRAFEMGERLQVAVEQAERGARRQAMARQVFGMGNQGLSAAGWTAMLRIVAWPGPRARNGRS